MQVSVIVPVHNGGSDLRICLQALTQSSRGPDELIVVDDASSDGSAELGAAFGTLVQAGGDVPLGPARARNRGAAQASGDILVFVDADVKVHTDTIAAIVAHFEQHAEIAALFGSYDQYPPHRDVVSLYKNLQHHFVHQHGRRDASTFWSGTGAIRRDVFLRLGGFSEAYPEPSIEDIELGVRLKRAGCPVRLCPDVQVTHLKRWNLLSLLRSDIFQRAVPWTKLILTTSDLPSDLNLGFKSRWSALCVWALALVLLLGIWYHLLWIAALPLLGLLVTWNFGLYRVFYEEGGIWFLVGAIPLHFLYFFYSSLTFAILWTAHSFSEGKAAYRLVV